MVMIITIVKDNHKCLIDRAYGKDTGTTWEVLRKEICQRNSNQLKVLASFPSFRSVFDFVVFCVCIKRGVFSFCCYTYIATTSIYKVNRYKYIQAFIAKHLSILEGGRGVIIWLKSAVNDIGPRYFLNCKPKLQNLNT